MGRAEAAGALRDAAWELLTVTVPLGGRRVGGRSGVESPLLASRLGWPDLMESPLLVRMPAKLGEGVVHADEGVVWSENQPEN